MVNARKECQLILEDLTKTIVDSIEMIIGGNVYNRNKVDTWTGEIVDMCLSVLAMKDYNYKYVVMAMIMQKNGDGFHIASSCYWNKDEDVNSLVCWENNDIHCVVSVFGLAV